MHPRTYDIQDFPTQVEADKQGYTVPLTKEEATELNPMNRKQRRAWLAQQRKAGKKVRL